MTQTTDSYAVFGQIDYQLAPKLRTTLGARWSRDEKRAPFVGFNTLVSGVSTPPIDLVREDSWDSTTYLASVDYSWNDWIMTYASYSTGFKAGGFQEGVNPVVVSTYYDPETVEQVEVGLKSDLFDGRVRFNVSAYRSRYEDLQVNNFRILPTGPVQLIQNAAGALVYGFDVEAKVQIGEHFILTALDSYIPTAKIEGFSSIGGFPSIEGFRIPRTPENSYTLALDYGTELNAEVRFKARAEYSHRSDFSSVRTLAGSAPISA
ncbi:MAG: TonB-dependent receptor [Proteobacteria bacterium]|nr:TonB-dependent receptor [Pseudomonadota bacterium]